jgi:predicted nucleic acid-binding protein
MLDSTAAVAAERQGKNARQLLETVALETGDEGIAVSVVTVLELAHGITRRHNRPPRPPAAFP